MKLKHLLAILALAVVVIASAVEAPAQCRSRRVVVRRTYHHTYSHSYSSYHSSGGGYVVARPVVVALQPIQAWSDDDLLKTARDKFLTVSDGCPADKLELVIVKKDYHTSSTGALEEVKFLAKFPDKDGKLCSRKISLEFDRFGRFEKYDD